VELGGKGPREAKHDVNLKIANDISIGNTVITISISKDGDRLGTLTISKGGINWRPRSAKAGKKGETQLEWTRFDEWMKEANSKKRRKS
jgi:hypothetical protein